MNTRKEPSWQVSICPRGNTEKRQHIDSVPSSGAAGDVVQYVRQRVPPTDIVSANYGPVIAPGGDYDLRQLREAVNVPGEGHEGSGPMKPLVIP